MSSQNQEEYKIHQSVKLKPGRRVKIVPRQKSENMWSGFVRYKQCKDYISPYIDKKGNLYTGLDRDQEIAMEKLLRKDEGELTKESEFWNDFAVIMTNKDKELDLGIASDLLCYNFLLGHKNVANSWDEYNEGKWPEAKYVITDDEKDAVIENRKNEIKLKASILFSNLSYEQKTSLLKLYTNNLITDNVSEAVISSRLFKEMENDPEKFVSFVEDKNLDLKLFIKQCVSLKILRKNRQAYYYNDDMIGNDEQDVIDYLNDPQNQGFLIGLKKDVELKTKK